MTGNRRNRHGWPYEQPINVDFGVNWDSPQSLGLVAWWPMLGGQGGWPILDRAFQRYPMTPFNTPTWASDGGRGWSILFDDAASEYLEIDSAPVTAVPLTMACWFNQDTLATQSAFTFIGDKDVFNNYFALMTGGPGNDEVAFIARDAGGLRVATTTTSYVINTWFHVCGVATSATDRAVFLNGGGKDTNVVATTPIGADRTAIGRLGDSSPDNYMSGRLADIRIYNRALSDSEVFDLYSNPWELYRPIIPYALARAPAVAAAIMNQIQFGNLGADLYDGTLI